MGNYGRPDYSNSGGANGTGDTNPITGTDWTTDTGGPYLSTGFPTTIYNTYAYIWI